MRIERVELGRERDSGDGGRRYRPVEMTFDTRASILATEISDDWEPQIQKQWRDNQARLREELAALYGVIDADRKAADFVDLGPAPWSIVFHHNHLLDEVRAAFTYGAYYPALVGACALGERILNQFVLELRDDYVDHRATSRRIRNADQFNDWSHPIDVLEAWGVFSPATAGRARELADLRHRAVHYRLRFDDGARAAALDAIRLIQQIIEDVLSPHGGPPKFIANTPGFSFFALDAEVTPLIRRIFLPRSALVSPRHAVHFDVIDGTIHMALFDDVEFPADPLSDEEFAARLAAGMSAAALALEETLQPPDPGRPT